MTIEFSENELLLEYVKAHSDIIPVLVDVGAHVGHVSFRFADMGWRVVAFEPEPYNHQKLQERLGKREHVTIIQKAISNEMSGEVEFYVSSEHYGIHSLQPFHETHTETITVETTRVDSVLRDLQIEQVGFLKVDIEGADFLALQSMDFDAIKPQLVMVEFMDERSQANFGYGFHDMVAYMEHYGYKTWVSEWAEIQSYGREGQAGESHHFIRCEPYPIDSEPAWGNLIFVPESDATTFQSILGDYLEKRKRYAKGTERRRRIEALPGGKFFYKLARKILKLIR